MVPIYYLLKTAYILNLFLKLHSVIKYQIFKEANADKD